MILFDTHGHLADSAYDADREDAIARLRAAGLAHAMVVADPCEEMPNQQAVAALLARYDFLVGAIGVHPQNAGRWNESAEGTLLDCLKNPRYVCLGEIGLDYHWDDPPRDVQRAAFDRQLQLALESGLPAQLHIRDAHGDATDMLRGRFRRGELPACILHCYSGSVESARGYLDMGCYISLSGSVTFKNARSLKDVAAFVPEDRLLVETDCPYMAPVPLRGRRNEPAYVAHTLACVAEIRGEAPEALAETTTRNARRVFRVEESK